MGPSEAFTRLTGIRGDLGQVFSRYHDPVIEAELLDARRHIDIARLMLNGLSRDEAVGEVEKVTTGEVVTHD